MSQNDKAAEVAKNALQTYNCTVIFDASASIEVQATSPEEAAAKAEDELDGHQRLCHQCANSLETGDILGTHVYAGKDGDQILDTTMGGDDRRTSAEREKALTEEVARLRADAARLDWLEQQSKSYGFENEHHGNRWHVEGAYRTLRELIDAALQTTGAPA